MIQPGKLKLIPSADIPAPVAEANESHQAFVAASAVAIESIGVRLISGVRPETLTTGFLAEVLRFGGTNDDVQWMLDRGVIGLEDLPLWSAAVHRYAARDFS